jgi:hypothetical protein
MLFAVRLGLITSPGTVKRATGCGTLFSVLVGHRRGADAGGGHAVQASRPRTGAACGAGRGCRPAPLHERLFEHPHQCRVVPFVINAAVAQKPKHDFARAGWSGIICGRRMGQTEALPMTGRKADSGGPVPRWPCTTRTPSSLSDWSFQPSAPVDGDRARRNG